MFFSPLQPQSQFPPGSFIPTPTSTSEGDETAIRKARERSFPTPLRELHEQLALLLENRLERQVWRTCFDEHYDPELPDRRSSRSSGENEGRSTQAEREGRRLQSIINLYSVPPPSSVSSSSPSSSSRARERAGITPHVDLVGRYGDGIVGVCLLAGVVMDFRKVRADGSGHGGGGSRDDERSVDERSVDDDDDVDDGEEDQDSLFNSDSDPEERPTTEPSRTNPTTHHPVYLPARTIYLLTGPARYQWTHGIDPRGGDWIVSPPPSSVPSTSPSPSRPPSDCPYPSTSPSPAPLTGRTGNEKRYVLRDTRISVTFRWMKSGAEVLGGH
jgi:hypothetical protein